MLRLFAACLVVLALGAAGTEAHAAGGVRLTDALKQELAGLPHLRGKPLTAGTLDRKIVVVTFFASWCPPCVEEFGHLNKVYADYRDAGVEFIAVNLFEDFGGSSNRVRLTRFLDRFDPAYAVVTGTDAVSEAFGTVTRIPTLFVFDRTGRPAFTFVHERGAEKMYLRADELAAVIAKLR